MIAGDGWTVHRYATVDSTQHVAAALIAQGAAHRTVVVADRQTAGYGRKGNPWLDAPGDALLITLILRPTWIAAGGSLDGSRLSRLPKAVPPPMPAHYVMAASLAARDAIAETTGAHGAIKWPNDLVLGGRKVGGILGDATWIGGELEALRVGIGLNLRGARAAFAARELPGATSIAAETGRDVDRDAFLAVLLRHFERYDDLLARCDAAAIARAWRAALVTIGQAVAATMLDGSVIAGIATDAADDGDLLVTAADGTVTRLAASAVRSLRPAG